MTSSNIMDYSFEGLYRSPVSLHVLDLSVEDEAVYFESILVKSKIYYDNP